MLWHARNWINIARSRGVSSLPSGFDDILRDEIVRSTADVDRLRERCRRDVGEHLFHQLDSALGPLAMLQAELAVFPRRALAQSQAALWHVISAPENEKTTQGVVKPEDAMATILSVVTLRVVFLDERQASWTRPPFLCATASASFWKNAARSDHELDIPISRKCMRDLLKRCAR